MHVFPQLPGEFYSSHPKLDHIRRAAHSLHNPTSPDAALGACLARVAALVPVGITFRGFLGGNVNYLVGLVGPSGAGKSTAHRLARYLIPDLGPSTLDSVPIGSGEGMVESYMRTVTRKNDAGRNETVKELAYESAYYYVDEAEGFINRSKAEASTALATLRALWSGADAGARNARTETSRHLKDGTYRFTAVFGFQPTYAMQLITDDKAGTPQRFLFVSALDVTMPDVGPSDPGPLAIIAPAPGDISIDQEITRNVTRRRRQIQRGEITLDPLDSHRDQLQLRTAYLLAVLCGESRAGITVEWWNRAGQLLDVSRDITNSLRDDALREEHDARQARAMDRIETADIIDNHKTKRIAANAGKWARVLNEEHGGPVRWEKIRAKLRNSERYAITADDAVSLGYVRQLATEPAGTPLYGPGPMAV